MFLYIVAPSLARNPLEPDSFHKEDASAPREDEAPSVSKPVSNAPLVIQSAPHLPLYSSTPATNTRPSTGFTLGDPSEETLPESVPALKPPVTVPTRAGGSSVPFSKPLTVKGSDSLKPVQSASNLEAPFDLGATDRKPQGALGRETSDLSGKPQEPRKSPPQSQAPRAVASGMLKFSAQPTGPVANTGFSLPASTSTTVQVSHVDGVIFSHQKVPLFNPAVCALDT